MACDFLTGSLWFIGHQIHRQLWFLMHRFDLKFTKIRWRLRLCPEPHRGSSQRCPDPLVVYWGSAPDPAGGANGAPQTPCRQVSPQPSFVQFKRCVLEAIHLLQKGCSGSKEQIKIVHSNKQRIHCRIERCWRKWKLTRRTSCAKTEVLRSAVVGPYYDMWQWTEIVPKRQSRINIQLTRTEQQAIKGRQKKSSAHSNKSTMETTKSV
jgi:hypothetical protein